MQYPALVTQEGKRRLASFPDCPGCQTFAEPGEDLAALAAEALTGWLEVGLMDGEVPPRPSARGDRRIRRPRGGEVLWVTVPPRLTVALALRWARHAADLTQRELARKAGVSQQQIGKLERPDANPTIETLAKVARALGVTLDVALVVEPTAPAVRLVGSAAATARPRRTRQKT